MEEKQKVFVMGYKPINFTNSDTGEVVEGTQIFYVDYKQRDDKLGYEPARAFLRKDVNDAKTVKENGIGIYNVVLKVELRGNRPRIYVADFEHIKKADFITDLKEVK